MKSISYDNINVGWPLKFRSQSDLLWSPTFRHGLAVFALQGSLLRLEVGSSSTFKKVVCNPLACVIEC